MKKVLEDDILYMIGEKTEMDILQEPGEYHQFSESYEERMEKLRTQVKAEESAVKNKKNRNFMKRWAAAAAVVVLASGLSVGGYAKAVANAKTECDWLSINEENVEAYIKDPLCGFNFTLNGYKNLIGLLASIFDNYGWKVANKNLPIFFIAGSEDPVIGKESQWLASQNFLLKQGYSNVTGKLYKGLRHEILLEKEKEEVYKDVLAFLEK